MEKRENGGVLSAFMYNVCINFENATTMHTDTKMHSQWLLCILHYIFGDELN